MTVDSKRSVDRVRDGSTLGRQSMATQSGIEHKRFSIGCLYCRNVIEAEVTLHKDTTNGQLWDEIEDIAKKEGWQVSQTETNKRYCVCTECVTKRQLDEYDPRAKCAKCGHRSITQKYIPSIRPQANRSYQTPYQGIEHIKLLCKRCGYSWASYCKDHVSSDEKENSNDKN